MQENTENSIRQRKFRFGALKFSVLLSLVYFLQLYFNLNLSFKAGTSSWLRFFTSFLGHGGLEHLLNNLFFLALFGSIFERLTSQKTFYATFLAAAILANFSAFIFFPGTAIIGASGGAFGVLAALAAFKPRRIGLALGVPMPMWAVLAVYTLIQFAGLTTGGTNTAFEAHLMGATVGLTVGVWLRNKESRDKSGQDNFEDENWKEKIRRWEEQYMI